jgi:ornithine cyclodeaminase/alanine dehydrogenase-like protein (mu-crystallin family)
MALLVLNEDELRQIVTIPEAIGAVETAFIALAENRLHAPDTFTLPLLDPTNNVNVEGVYLREAPYFVVKIRNDFSDNPAKNLPIQSGLTTVFAAATGQPVAILLDNGYLSHLRAAAAGAVAAKYLANPQLNCVAVVGTGQQAYLQLKCLLSVRSPALVQVWGRSLERVDSYVRRVVEDHDLNMEIAPSLEAAIRQADLVITATSSQSPLIQADWLKPGVHLTAVGSDSPVKQELEPAVFQRADVIIVDQLEQCAAMGELHHALAAGVITPAQVQGEMGALMIGQIPGRTHPHQITLADLTGLDVQDAAVATLALEKALFLELGQRVEGRL